MCIPKEKIYNDAPDEFAEFIDSKREYVHLSELGGEANPFVVEGIYEPYEIAEKSCAGCEFDDPDNYDRDPDWCDQACAHCRAAIELAKNDPVYKINDMRLAEFISSGIGCAVCRQFKKTGWQFGKLRDYDVYFACSPTPGMYKALECTPKSILIIGMNTPDMLPTSLAVRVIYLSRLLYVAGGRLNFAQEAIEEKIPHPRRRTRRTDRMTGGEGKKYSRPPIQVYAPYYLAMICEWLERLREKNEIGTPSFGWVTRWIHSNCHIQNINSVGERQIRRHVKTLMSGNVQSGRLDKRSPTFAVYWNGCNDKGFITKFSREDIASLIINTFEIAKKTGFKVTPMKGMDAAEYADKVVSR